MKNPYEVLGITQDATDIEVKNAYRQLARKYHPDNFSNDSDMAKLAEERMKEINEAYDEIMSQRISSNGSEYVDYIAIRNIVKQGKFAEAERRLDEIPKDARSAEWHYIKSVLLNRRGWVNDAMRELETACEMDPQNLEYQQAKEMFNAKTKGFGGQYNPYGGQRQGGAGVCDMITGLLCADCCCECMGGDLIPCC
ncbi:MAG: DnaJ domain-containing protein [Eubacteriales bacterium]|nr:DnaJ domain-containing protein [Eubacteriales bacterium]